MPCPLFYIPIDCSAFSSAFVMLLFFLVIVLAVLMFFLMSHFGFVLHYCISLVTNDVQNLFLGSLAICFPLMK